MVEVIFNIAYKGEKEKQFDWMYINYNTLQNTAFANELKSELIFEGEPYDYLAKLSISKNKKLQTISSKA